MLGRVGAHSSRTCGDRRLALPTPIMHRIAGVQGPKAGRAVGVGKQLEAAEYGEQEYVIHGAADLYAYDAQWQTRVERAALPFRTRILVRAPLDAGRAS